mgnify:CR=1 FL=1
MMKDKFKGLVVGLCLGSMLAGSAVYASGTQIEVYFNNLKYMFDGVEKKPSLGKGFIYEGTTYVPLRFMSETLGKEVKWDEANQTIWVGQQKIVEPAALYKGGRIEKAEFDLFLVIMQFYNPGYTNSLTEPSFREEMLKQNLIYKIFAERGRAISTKDLKEKAKLQLLQLRKDFDKAFNNTPTWEQRLIELKLKESDLQDYIENRLMGNEYLLSKVDDSKLQAEYKSGLEANKFLFATVSHVLISFVRTDGTARPKEEALQRAKDIATNLKNGDHFAAVAKQFSDDPGSKDNGGVYTNANVNNYVSTFRDAVITQPLNQIGEPVETEYGYHVIRVDERSTKTYAEVKEVLSNPYIQTIYQEFMTKELPDLITKLTP